MVRCLMMMTTLWTMCLGRLGTGYNVSHQISNLSVDEITSENHMVSYFERS